MEKIILIGAGGHAKTVADTIERLGIYEIAGFVDVKPVGTHIYRTYSVIASDNDLHSLWARGIKNAFVCIGYVGNSEIRNNLYRKLKAIGYNLPVIIDTTAVVASDACIGDGTYVGRCAVINADAAVGKMCIINTGAVVEHECIVADYAHISVGTVLCGQVTVGEMTFIGANATIIQGLKIGSKCIVGAGSVVLKDINNFEAAAGCPAVQIRKK